MMPSARFDVICVGAGIVGLATALHLQRHYRCRVGVIEAEAEPATHQTDHNSGVLHSGLYYQSGSLKARNCVAGRKRLVDFCRRHDIAYEICGKLVIATQDREISRLDELERRGRANGLGKLLRVGAAGIPDYEPNARGVDALWVGETGIVDFGTVARVYADLFQEGGGELLVGHSMSGARIRGDELSIETTGGRLSAGYLINCAGLQSDRVARLAGARPRLRIVPFRGDYFQIAERRRALVRNLIYPVPDPRFPFLGVHLTRRIDGQVEAGPNAVLALHRHGYTTPRFSWRDTSSTLFYPGFWRLAARYWRVGLGEMLRSGSQRRFAAALRQFVPDLTADDLTVGGCGIRAQALDSQGRLLDDFALDRSPRALHVLNAPSPAATASLAIGEHLADMAGQSFSLTRR